jgi:hypothetical protein
VRTRTVLRLLIASAFVLALAAPAAAQGTAGNERPLVAAGLSFLNVSESTAIGFAVDFAKQVRPMDKAAISIVGDVNFHHEGGEDGFGGGNAFGFLGGVRFTSTTNEQYQPFGQFLLGGTRFSASDCDEDCSETPFTISFGGGIDVRINDKWNFRGQLDIPIFMFEGESETGVRFMFGVSTRIGQ